MNIARQWFERAKSFNDEYDKFISAYIVLNYYYGGMRKPKESGRNCMVRCAESWCKAFGVDPFDCDVSEYQKSPVLDMRYAEKCYPVENKRTDLFSAIYQVRCNLFHGNKSLNDQRDRRLVEQGANVLILLLQHKLNSEEGIRH